MQKININKQTNKTMPNSGTEIPRVLCDFWYGDALQECCVSFESYVRKRCHRPVADLILRLTLLRLLCLLWYGRKFDLVAPNWYLRGRLFCLVSGLFLRKKIVLFECIDMDMARLPAPVRGALAFCCRHVIGPAMRRAVVKIHTMTEFEGSQFCSRYGLPADMVQTIPWPLSGWNNEIADTHTLSDIPSNYVFSSGRVACDWEALFAAAELGQWPLVVVCSAKDYAKVQRLNRSGRATVLHEIPRTDHNWLLANAKIYALCLKEQNKSSGQVRLGVCTDLGVPVVASSVRGLDGYAIENVTAKLVPVGDAGALARAIGELFEDEDARRSLVETARRYGRAYSRSNYFEDLKNMLCSASRISA